MVGLSPLRDPPSSLGNFRAIVISWRIASVFPSCHLQGTRDSGSSKEGPHSWMALPSISQQRTNLVIFGAWQKAHLLIRVEKQEFLLLKKNNALGENNLIP